MSIDPLLSFKNTFVNALKETILSLTQCPFPKNSFTTNLNHKIYLATLSKH